MRGGGYFGRSCCCAIDVAEATTRLGIGCRFALELRGSFVRRLPGPNNVPSKPKCNGIK